MNTSLIFFTFIIGIILSYHSNEFNKKNCYIFFSIILSIIIATRDENTPDTINYLNFYKNIEIGNLVSLSMYSFEPGFQIYTHILKIISLNNSTIYLFYISITNSLILYRVINNFDKSLESNPLLFLILYYSFFGLFYNAIVIRAGIAISLMLYAISIENTSMPQNRKKILTYFLFIISISFHYSAILSIFIYILYKIIPKLPHNVYIIIWIIATMIFVCKISSHIIPMLLQTLLDIFDKLSGTNFNKYSYYITELYKLNDQLPYRLIFQFIACLLFIPVNTNQKEYYKLLNIYLLGLFLSSLFYSIEQLSRITDYFLIFSSFLFYFIFQKYLRNKYIIIPYISTIFLHLIFIIRIIKDN